MLTKSKTPFALISRQRSGTKLLKLTLSQHPEIFAHTEVLSVNREKGKRPYNVYRYMMTRFEQEPATIMENKWRENYRGFLHHLYSDPEERIVGLDLKYNQLDQFPTFKTSLWSQSSIKVIHLIRRNVLRQYLSEKQHQLLDRTKIKDSEIYTIGALPITPIDIECNDAFLNAIQSLLEQIEQYRTEICSTFPCLELFYEDFMYKGENIVSALPDDIVMKLYNFLGVNDKSFALEVTRKAQHPYPIRELIKNHEEILEFLKTHSLDYLMDDEFGKRSAFA